jgi:DNA-binding NarL/FixJ family response regulator
MNLHRSPRPIVLVEDHVQLRNSIGAFLTHGLEDVVILETDRGEGALSILCGTPPALVFIGVRLGSPRDLALVRRIREIRPEVPIVALVDEWEMPGADRLRDVGANACLGKNDLAERLVPTAKAALAAFDCSEVAL